MGYHGIYRGRVAGNLDPNGLGRVQVSVPAVLGEGRMAWAMPCSPYAGNGVGLFLVPPVDASVWVAFENGDLDRPIVLGGFWAMGEAPATPALAQKKVLKTDAVTLTFDDTSGAGGVTIEVTSPAVAKPVTIKASSSGLELSVGGSKIVLNGISVSVNDGALEVT